MPQSRKRLRPAENRLLKTLVTDILIELLNGVEPADDSCRTGDSKKLKTAVPREPVRATRDARAGSAPRVVAALRRFSFLHSFRFRGAREGGGGRSRAVG